MGCREDECMSVTNIVLTGGPCAGKSTGLSRIEQELSKRGYKVYVVAETATEVITGGIKPSEISWLEFQMSIFEIQTIKEKIFRERAEEYSKKHNVNCVIIYDRGLLDAKAFMSNDDYFSLLRVENKSEIEVKDSYDGVFHLKTAADGAELFYTLENNNARSETPEEARKIDKKIIKAWTGHPHLRIIDNSTNFREKIDRLMVEIYSLLGEPIPTEIERKYLIKMPNIAELCEKYPVTKLNIIQTYLNSFSDVERRVRQRGTDGVYSYYYTEKRGMGLTRVEVEKKISKEEYLDYLMDADTTLHQIRKDRYCFVFENNYIELDVYPFWKNYAIIEIELSDENQEIVFPDDIVVIKEVTEDYKFKNKSLASNIEIL